MSIYRKNDVKSTIIFLYFLLFVISDFYLPTMGSRNNNWLINRICDRVTHTHTHTRTLVGRQRRPDRLFSGRANGSLVCVSSWRHGTPHQEGLLDHIHRILFQVSIDSFAFFFIFLVCVCVFLARFLWTYVLQQPTPRRYREWRNPLVVCCSTIGLVGSIMYVVLLFAVWMKVHTYIIHRCARYRERARADSLVVVLIRLVAHASNGLPQLFSLELIIVAISSLSSSSIGSAAPPQLLFAAIRMIISLY